MSNEKDVAREFGEKYQYPKCCIDYFFSGEMGFQKEVSWNGFIPCKEHQKLSLEEITDLLGRNPFDEINVTVERKCYTCKKVFNVDLLTKDNYDNLVCAVCNPNNYCYKCHVGLEESGEIYMYDEYSQICYPCISKRIGIEIDDIEVYLECINEKASFDLVQSISEFAKDSMGNVIIKFSCLECGDEHTSQILVKAYK